MSDPFRVEVVSVMFVDPLFNSDSLECTAVITTDGKVHEAIFGTGEFKPGDLAVAVPPDAIVPNTKQWAWLWAGRSEPNARHRRVKRRRLRGFWSDVVLMPLPEELRNEDPFNIIGLDVAEWMGITQYVRPVKPGPTPRKYPRRRKPKSLWSRLKQQLRAVLAWAGFEVQAPVQMKPVALPDPNTTEYALGNVPSG